jgi:hypothetical protein
MQPPGKKDLPMRAGVYSDIRQVDSVVLALLAAGFTHQEITIVCSDEAAKHHFRDFARQDPAGARLPVAAATGGAAGAAVGGVATAAIALATGVLPVAIIGSAGLMTGGVVGSLLGAFLTRGGEQEPADFYDQAVQDGKLLVVVERKNENDSGEKLASAERLFTESGSKPLPLPEG